MSDYGYESDAPTPDTVEQPPDPRVIAVHRVVDLEKQAERSQLKAERAQKEAAVVSNELREARDVLSGLLGYPSNSGMKAMDRDELRAMKAAAELAERMAQ